jgi:hypothetical protein
MAKDQPKKQRVLDPRGFYLHGGKVHGPTDDDVVFDLNPVEKLAEELGAKMQAGSLKPVASVPGQVSGLPETDSRGVTASGNIAPESTDDDEDEDEDDEEDEDQEEGSESAYANWTKKQLQAEAEKRGLEVERADGGDGAPLASDYLSALEEDDASEDDEDEGED